MYVCLYIVEIQYSSQFWNAQGDLYDHDSLVKAVKQVDVVISVVTFQQILDQSKILDAIKKAGNIMVSPLYF